MPRLMRNFFAGHVSRTTLLTGLLLAFTCFISSVVVGICMYPAQFDWRKRVMSRAISPHYNPDGFWIPALGVAASALLMLPFAGYLERRVQAISPRGSRLTGLAFTIGILLFLGVALPLPAHLPLGLDRLHEIFARVSVTGLVLGVLGCCVCAFKDRQRSLDSRSMLRNRLTVWWVLFPLVLVGFGLVCGIMQLGRLAQMEWALYAGRVLKPTMFWQLAFWEWVGVLAFFGFLFLSALWLPEHVRLPALALTASERDPLIASGNDSRVAIPVGGVNGHARRDVARFNANELLSGRAVGMKTGERRA